MSGLLAQMKGWEPQPLKRPSSALASPGNGILQTGLHSPSGQCGSGLRGIAFNPKNGLPCKASSFSDS